MRFLKAILPLLFTAALVWALSGAVPGLPALGMLLSPFHGFWQQAETGVPVASNEELRVQGLRDEAQIAYDRHLVPHIFARNNHDLYFVQGYVTARMRLWQMEIQTRLAAGRLSEVMGRKTLETDRKFRRMGMEWAAERSLAEMRKTPATAEALDAYAAGVNAWIDQLDPRDYPLMYKLLGHAPRRWEPLHTALLLKLMSWDLTGESTDLALSRVRAQYGEAVAEMLFPDFPPYQEPIVPGFVPAVVPAGPAFPMPPAVPAVPDPLAPVAPPPHNGSNNWAVDGSRSRSGFPLLANDPHLTLRLPSIWFRIQLSGPDGTVSGVSLPGAPCVIIGFNGSIAWGVTNLGADVQDWYKITYTPDRQHYVYDNSRRPLSLRTEKILVQGEPEVEEVVRYTHHGPVVYETADTAAAEAMPAGYALRWAGHEGGNELFTFYSLNRARSFASYRAALDHYQCPGQNFLFADTSGTVALWCTARLPRKAKGQGKYLLDGSLPRDEWQGWLPLDENPHIVRPAQGWAASANQHPAGPEYPHYLGWHFATWERASRIHHQLNSFRQADARAMRNLQTDDHNQLADKVLTHLMDKLKPTLSRQDKQLPAVQQGLDALDAWNLRNDAGSVGAAYFEAWWQALETDLWGPHFDRYGGLYPDRAVTAQLLLSADTSRWYVLEGKPAPLPQLLSYSYLRACRQLSAALPDTPARTWGRYKDSRIEHMAYIDAFGHLGLSTSGAAHSVNAMGQTHGPSWRMVVEVGPQVRGFGIFPGGQSENPGSTFYDDGIAPWLAGHLRTIDLVPSPEALPEAARLAVEHLLPPRE
ncbi:MAG: penicillin acylase family protein [Bacteroidetes bacterium]|nr:penicillin acylase family protein [Bacteroidota bacterium]